MNPVVMNADKGAGNTERHALSSSRMAVRDEDFGSGLTLVESDDGIWSSPEAAPACAPRDWRSECEREHARADAAEARCEELRWAEVESRARTGSLKWQLDRSRSKLKAAVEETQEVRRTAKDALWTHAGKVGGALHRLHCFCLEFDGACEVQRRVPTDWIIETRRCIGLWQFQLGFFDMNTVLQISSDLMVLKKVSTTALS